jgi:hypothetical protein
MQITEKQKNIVALIKRSQPNPDGWYSISETVWPLVDGTLPDDLVETEKLETGGRLRVTDIGTYVFDYI